MRKHRVFTGAQQKHTLQHLNAFLHCPRIREGTKKLRFFVYRAPVIGHARVGVVGQPKVGVAFVITKQNVVAWAQAFNQVVFKQQRLGFGAGGRYIHTHNAFNHVAGARA